MMNVQASKRDMHVTKQSSKETYVHIKLSRLFKCRHVVIAHILFQISGKVLYRMDCFSA
jgi:hypothetical protein